MRLMTQRFYDMKINPSWKYYRYMDIMEINWYTQYQRIVLEMDV